MLFINYLFPFIYQLLYLVIYSLYSYSFHLSSFTLNLLPHFNYYLLLISISNLLK